MKRSDATAALSWANNTRATSDTRVTPTELHVLCVIAGGCRTRTEIASAVGCGESTVPRAVRKLVKLGALKRIENPGKANDYAVQTRAIDTGISDDTRVATSRTAKNTGVVLAPPSANTGGAYDTPKNGAHIENASAGAENNLLTLEELYPDRAESVCGRPVMPVGGGMLDMDWTLSDPDRAFANERGYLNGSCDELFGKFLDRCATKGPMQSPAWRSEWKKWVRNEVKFDTERAQRFPAQATFHDHASSATASPIRREKISAATAQRERDRARLEAEARDRTIDLGRLESVRVE